MTSLYLSNAVLHHLEELILNFCKDSGYVYRVINLCSKLF